MRRSHASSAERLSRPGGLVASFGWRISLRCGSIAAMKYYPVFLRLAGRRCVVVGGGEVAERKVAIAAGGGRVGGGGQPDADRSARRAGGRRRDRPRRRRPTGAATWRGRCSPMRRRTTRRCTPRSPHEAEASGVLLNVVDRPRWCTFIVPSLMSARRPDRGGIDRGGSPALARRVREDIEHALGPEYERALDVLARLRRHLQERVALGRRASAHPDRAGRLRSAGSPARARPRRRRPITRRARRPRRLARLAGGRAVIDSRFEGPRVERPRVWTGCMRAPERLAMPGARGGRAHSRTRDPLWTVPMDLIFFAFSLALDLAAAVAFIVHLVVGRETPRRLALARAVGGVRHADDRSRPARRDARHRHARLLPRSALAAGLADRRHLSGRADAL